MPASTSFANSLLDLFLRSVAIADLAENDATSPATNLYIRLHTGPLAAGDPGNTNECVHGAYIGLAINRTGTGWNAAASGQSANAALAQFLECTSGSEAVSHVSVNKAQTGAGACMWSGALAATRTVSAGIQPQFAPGGLVIQVT